MPNTAAAAHTLTQARRPHHITPKCTSLHWLKAGLNTNCSQQLSLSFYMALIYHKICWLFRKNKAFTALIYRQSYVGWIGGQSCAILLHDVTVCNKCDVIHRCTLPDCIYRHCGVVKRPAANQGHLPHYNGSRLRNAW